MTPQIALDFAKKLHKGQKRQTGEDYIEHPIRVFTFLKIFNLPEEILIAGILHDICEKTTADYQEIKNKFGNKINEMIYALSKEKPSHKTKQEHLEDYTQKIREMGQIYPGIFLVKMADQLDNLQSLFIFPREKRHQKIREIQDLFLPLYHKELENCPKHLKAAFSILLRQLVDNIRKRELTLKCIRRVETC